MPDDPKTAATLAAPPIPREDAPTPDPVMTALAGISKQLTDVQTSQIDLVTRVTRLEEKAPGSNPPPRTASGFTAAVRQISQSTESEPDKATAAQVVELRERLTSIEKKTDAQTELLHILVDGLGSFARNPTVRKIAYVAGGLLLGWLTHLAAASSPATKGLMP